MAKLQPLQTKSSHQKSPFVVFKFVRNRISRTIYKINQHFTLQSHKCVYIIFCFKCDKQYIGEIKNSINIRMWQHKYNITPKSVLRLHLYNFLFFMEYRHSESQTYRGIHAGQIYKEKNVKYNCKLKNQMD